MAEENKKNIYQKLVEVRRGIDSFSKDTDGYNFKYVSGTQVLSQIKKGLDIQGIILEPHLIDPKVHLINPKVEKLGRDYLILSTMKMVWVNSDDPKDRVEINWFMVGKQKDPSQSFGSGLTYAERYFMLKFFNIPTDEDDPDILTKENYASKDKANSENSKKIEVEKTTDDELEKLKELAFTSSVIQDAYMKSFKGSREDLIEKLKKRIDKGLA